MQNRQETSEIILYPVCLSILFGQATRSGSGNKDKGFASMPHEHFVPLGCQHEPWEFEFPFESAGVGGINFLNWCGITGKKVVKPI